MALEKVQVPPTPPLSVLSNDENIAKEDLSSVFARLSFDEDTEYLTNRLLQRGECLVRLGYSPDDFTSAKPSITQAFLESFCASAPSFILPSYSIHSSCIHDGFVLLMLKSSQHDKDSNLNHAKGKEEDCWWSEVDDLLDVRIAVVGNVDAGKSTTLGVLTRGSLDDGRGQARYSVPYKAIN